MKKLTYFFLIGLSFLVLTACSDHSHDGTYVMFQHVSKKTFQLSENQTFEIEGNEIKGDNYTSTLDYSNNIQKKNGNKKNTPFEFLENGDVIVFNDPEHPNSKNDYHRNYFVKKDSKYYKYIEDNLAFQSEEEKY
jgi:lipoprotein